MKKNTLIITLFSLIILTPIVESCKKVEKIQHNVMEYSLNKLGETFFSLMPDSKEKNNLKSKYDSFVQRSLNGEVEQGQIEYVAANMMNASNSHDTIKPELASNIVETMEPEINTQENTQDITEASHQVLMESQQRSLGEKLSKLMDFNDKVKSSYQHDKIAKKVFYKFDKGIVINIDEELKAILNDSKEEFKYFESNQELKWVKDLSKNLELEKIKFEAEMKKLEDLKINLKDLAGIEGVKYLKFSDTSFISPYMPKINIDSIMESVEQSLKAAGIKEVDIIKK